MGIGPSTLHSVEDVMTQADDSFYVLSSVKPGDLHAKRGQVLSIAQHYNNYILPKYTMQPTTENTYCQYCEECVYFAGQTAVYYDSSIVPIMCNHCHDLHFMQPSIPGSDDEELTVNHMQ